MTPRLFPRAAFGAALALAASLSLAQSGSPLPPYFAPGSETMIPAPQIQEPLAPMINYQPAAGPIEPAPAPAALAPEAPPEPKGPPMGSFDISGARLGMSMEALSASVSSQKPQWAEALSPAALAACASGRAIAMLSPGPGRAPNGRFDARCANGVAKEIQLDSALGGSMSMGELLAALQAKYGPPEALTPMPRGEMALSWSRPSSFCSGSCSASEALSAYLQPEPGLPGAAGRLSLKLSDPQAAAAVAPAPAAPGRQLPF